MSDSLILKIEEHDPETQVNTNTIFVLYDKYNFIIRGEKPNNLNDDVIPYSFSCSDINSLVDFISLVSKHELQYSLYVHSDLPMDSNVITYDYLTENLNDCHDLTGNYKPGLLSALSIVRNVFNSY